MAKGRPGYSSQKPALPGGRAMYDMPVFGTTTQNAPGRNYRGQTPEQAKKAEADDISSRVIPELLQEQGLQEIKLADGSKVSVKKEFRATLPKDDLRRESAYQWLRDQGLGDIIKNNVTVSFGRGEDNKANQMMDLAVANGFTPQQKSDVAWNTLTALYEERVKAGLDMPSDVFSLWIKDKTKISRKK